MWAKGGPFGLDARTHTHIDNDSCPTSKGAQSPRITQDHLLFKNKIIKKQREISRGLNNSLEISPNNALCLISIATMRPLTDLAWNEQSIDAGAVAVTDEYSE